MAIKPRVQLVVLTIGDKPHQWGTDYFTQEDIDRIFESANVLLSKAKRGYQEEEIARKNLLKEENAIPKQADHLFDNLIFELGRLWTDPRIFNQSKVGISTSSLEGQARGPFIRYAVACCQVLWISSTISSTNCSKQAKRQPL